MNFLLGVRSGTVRTQADGALAAAKGLFFRRLDKGPERNNP